MELNLIYGKTGSGKTYHILEQIQNNIKNHEKVILLVPEHYSKSYEDLILDRFGGSMSMYLEVLSFQRLALRVFSKTGGLSRPYISKSGKNIMMVKILLKLKNRLKLFGKTELTDGYTKTIVEAVSEFKRYGLQAQTIAKAGETLELHPLLQLKLEDLAQIYQSYDDEINQNHMDKDDNLQRMLNVLEAYEGWENSAFYVDGFYGFTKIEFDVLLRVIQKAKSVTICLPLESLSQRNELYRPVFKTYDRLLDLARENQIPLKNILQMKQETASLKSKELIHLRDWLYHYPAPIYKEHMRDIAIHSASDLFSESEYVTSNILELVYQKKARFRDIVVLVSDMENYGSLLSSVFQQAEIPYFLDSKEDILNHPLVILTVCALECILKNYTHDMVFRLIKTGFFRISFDDIDVFENYCLLKGMKWNDYKKEEKWELSEEQEELYPNVQKSRETCIAPVLQLDSKVKVAKTAQEYCGAIYEFLTRVDAYSILQEKIQQFQKDGALVKAAQYSQVWNILMDTLDQIVYAMGEDSISVENFVKIYKGALSEYEMKVVPQSLDEVMITTKDRLSDIKEPYLFFMGVNDGIIPSANTGEGILKDADRELLKKIGIDLAGGHFEKAYDEQFLIHKVLSMPTCGLFISYPLTDFDGSALYPSMLISQILPLYSHLQVEDDSKDSLDKYLLSKGFAFEKMVQNALLNPDSKEIDPVYAEMYRYFERDETYGARLKQVMEALKYSNVPNKIKKESVEELFGNEVNLSISQLEKYASCHFSYFMEYMLQAKERQELKVSAVDLGFLIHCALEAFSKKLESEGLSYRDLTEELTDRYLDEIFISDLFHQKENVLSNSKRNEYVKLRLNCILKRCILLLGEHFKRSEFQPLGYEMEFAKGGAFPPIKISIDGMNEEIYIRGKIDRVDVYHDPEDQKEYVRVVDYKSGSKTLKLSEVYDGLNLQLFTYLSAVMKSLSSKENASVLPSGVLYFRIYDPILSSKCRLGEEQIQKEVMKNMKMSGLVLKDEKIVKKMDREIDGVSDIIPASLNKEGEVKSTGSTADEKQFLNILKHVDGKIKTLAKDLLCGDIAINPYSKSDQRSCDYCPCSAVCGFDKEYNQFRRLSGLLDSQVLEVLKDDGR